jgi:hypothetical protein
MNETRVNCPGSERAWGRPGRCHVSSSPSTRACDWATANCGRGVGAVVVVLCLMLASCGSSSGTVVGVFDGTGNTPTHVGGVPSAGKLTLTSGSGGRSSYKVEVGSNGRFSIDVAPGTYHVVARAPGQRGGASSCTADVQVSPGRTSHTAVTCVFHQLTLLNQHCYRRLQLAQNPLLVGVGARRVGRLECHPTLPPF